MVRKAVTYTTLVCMLAAMPLGCYSRREVMVADLNPPRSYVGSTIIALVTTEGEVIEFPRDDAPVLYNSTTVIVGTPNKRSRPAEGGGWTKPESIPSEERERYSIPLERVRTVYLETRSEAGGAIIIVAITVVVLAVVVGAGVTSCTREVGESIADSLGSSCPYIYAFDGERYLLEGIPYVGSMCEALERTEVVRLDHLVSIDGEYRVRAANDAEETEYINEFVLVVADHEPGTELVPDARGVIHSVEGRQRPVDVTDQHGHDWTRWLGEKDYLYWEGDAFAMEPSGDGGLRDTLVFKFEVPASATTAKLMVSGGHSTWAIGLERELLGLWGSDVSSLYEQFRDAGFRERFWSWVRREEVIDLAVRVRTRDGWRVADRVSPDAPAADGEHVAVVDLSGVEGEMLEVALAPPAGLWRINAVTADFSEDAPIDIRQIAASSARDNGGEDLRSAIDAADGSYVIQPRKGMCAHLIFPAPPSTPGRERTVFARTTGYYDIHLDAQGSANTDEVARLEREVGYTAEFALRYHRKRCRDVAALASR